MSNEASNVSIPPLVLTLVTALFAACGHTRPPEPAAGPPAVIGTTPETRAETRAASDATARARLLGYGKIPLHFEAAAGQTGRARYLTRGPGYVVYLTATESVFALHRRTVQSGAGTVGEGRSAVVRARLVGASAEPELVAVEELPGKANYFIGNDPSRWRRNVPLYAKVRAKDVYPGIDVVYYGNPRQLEHDLVVAPGADPRQIRLAFEGQTEPLRLDDDGNLVVPLAGGEVLERAPVVYQEANGRREPIDGRFVLHPVAGTSGETQEIGFAIAAYDATRTLVIDPVLVYSTYLGGTSGEGVGTAEFGAIAIDASGSAYVTGGTGSTDFPTQSPYQPALSSTSYFDAFVSKFTPDGSALVYSTYLGGAGGVDFGIGIAVDDAGQAYVHGLTYAPDFPTQSAFQPTYGGVQDNFVAKLTANGSALVYSTYLGGSGLEGNSGGIALDAAGGVYVTGATKSTDFPTQSPLQPALAGTTSVYVTKFNPDGASLAYSTYLGGDAPGAMQVPRGLAVDASGSAYVTGFTGAPNFPLVSPIQASCDTLNGNCGFVTKFTPAGTALVYSTYLGHAESRVLAIAVDARGNMYVTGLTTDPAFPTAAAFQPTIAGGQPEPFDAFVTKIASPGTSLFYSTYLGGAADDYGLGIAVDGLETAYVTGTTHSTDFPTQSPLQAANGGGNDAFVTRLDLGGGLAYSTYLGGSDNDIATAIALGPSVISRTSFVSAFVTGNTISANFPTQSPFQTDLGDAAGDAFVTKISSGDEHVQQTVLAGGTVTTDTEADGATPSDSIETSVTSPNAGTITIVEARLVVGVPLYQIDITAPDATPANPLVITFRVDASDAFFFLLFYKNGILVPLQCTGAPGQASPDPCLASQVTLPDGDVLVTIYSSTASLWTVVDPAAVPTCAAQPVAGCQAALSQKSTLTLKGATPDTKDKLVWKWTSSCTVGINDFGDPLAASNYLLCVYGNGALLMGAVAPAGQTCAGNPCWKTTSSGFRYADKDLTPTGLQKILLKQGGPGRAKILVRGKADELDDTTLPLMTPVRVQLMRTDGGPCWEATYSTPLSTTAKAFKAKSD